MPVDEDGCPTNTARYDRYWRPGLLQILQRRIDPTIHKPIQAPRGRFFSKISVLQSLLSLTFYYYLRYLSYKLQSKMRLPYVPNPPQFTDPDDQAILERVKARRGAMGLIELDLALLHAPKVADGW
jgi:hypothetical protein